MHNSEPAKHEQLSNIVSCEMQCSNVFCQQTLESFQTSFHMRNNVARYFVNKHTSSNSKSSLWVFGPAKKLIAQECESFQRCIVIACLLSANVQALNINCFCFNIERSIVSLKTDQEILSCTFQSCTQWKFVGSFQSWMQQLEIEPMGIWSRD